MAGKKSFFPKSDLAETLARKAIEQEERTLVDPIMQAEARRRPIIEPGESSYGQNIDAPNVSPEAEKRYLTPPPGYTLPEKFKDFFEASKKGTNDAIEAAHERFLRKLTDEELNELEKHVNHYDFSKRTNAPAADYAYHLAKVKQEAKVRNFKEKPDFTPSVGKTIRLTPEERSRYLLLDEPNAPKEGPQYVEEDSARDLTETLRQLKREKVAEKKAEINKSQEEYGKRLREENEADKARKLAGVLGTLGGAASLGAKQPEFNEEVAPGVTRQSVESLKDLGSAFKQVGKEVGKEAREFILGADMPSRKELEELEARGIEPGLISNVGILDPIDLVGFPLANKLVSGPSKALTKAAIPAAEKAGELLSSAAAEGVGAIKMGAKAAKERLPNVLKNLAEDSRAVLANEEGALKLIQGGRSIPKATPNPEVQAAAESYASERGLPYTPETKKVDVDPEFGKKVAKAYEEMKHDPNDPRVKASYDALIRETTDQLHHLQKEGYRFTPLKPGQPNPYAAGSDAVAADVRDNKHIFYYPTEQGFGEAGQANLDHPMLKMVKDRYGNPMPANDAFRIVHDIFGHTKKALTFGPKGEEMAFREHSKMYSPMARGALATETRGQNSWVNFGPHAEHNRANPAQTIYAEQKAGLLPEWAQEHYGGEPERLIHFSRSDEPLTSIDPKFMGTGAAGRESMRPGRIPRMYYYEAHSVPEDVVLSGAKTVHEIAKPQNIIDLSSPEAKKFIDAASAIDPSDPTSALEKMLHENGFSGYKWSEGPMPDAIALFDAQPVLKGEWLYPEHFEQYGRRRYAHQRRRNFPVNEPQQPLSRIEEAELRAAKQYAQDFGLVEESKFNPPQTVEAAAPKTKSMEEIKQLVLKDPRYLAALELEKQGFDNFANERYRHLLYEYEKKYNVPIAEGPVTRRPTYDVPEVAEALRGVPKDQRLMVLSNDANAYNALMAKYPQLKGREDWAELALADYVKHKAPPGKFAKVTSVNPTAKLGPKAKSTLEKVKENNLVFGEPEDYEKSFIAKNEAGEPIGHLGLDENQHTRSIKIDPDYRGQGIAPELYKKALNKYGVIRSDYRHSQLEGGHGLWESFERKYPGAVRQARGPETLKPLDYRVWQKDTNLEARKAEEVIEKQVDQLRSKHKSPRSHDVISAQVKENPEWIKANDLYEKTGKKEDFTARSEIYNRLYREIHAKAPKQTDIEKQIADLIKQHKALTKKSGHVMYATGGAVLSESPEGHEQKQFMFYDGGLTLPNEQQMTDTGLAPGEPIPTWEESTPIEEVYGTPSEMFKTAGEAYGRGLVGPFAPMAERAAGVSPEDIRLREEANPITSGLFSVAGFLSPLAAVKGASVLSRLGLEGLASVLPSAAKYTQLGALEAVGSKIAPFAGENLAARLGNAGARNLVEGTIYGGSDEISKMILEDPNQSVESAISNTMLSGMVGAALGIGVESAFIGAEKAAGSKLGKFIADFRGRVKEHMDNPNPVETMTKELDEYYNGIKNISSETYGPSGIKEKDIQKALPEMHSGVSELTANISNKLEEGIAKLGDDPHARMLRNAVEEWKEKIGGMGSVGPMGERITPLVEPKIQDVWQATEKLKQQLQEWGQYNKELVAVAERPFRNLSKSLSYDLRTALEDTNVWGKAGERQKAINAAFTEYLPALKDFEKRFTSLLAGERVIDPGKVATYLNQLGKPNAEIKQEILKNFLDHSESFKAAIDKTHANLGLESPVVETALNVTKNSLKEVTKGARLADAMINKTLTDTGAAALAAGAGVKAGGLLGISHELGAIMGLGTLSPLLKTILPALAKTFAEKEISPAGAKSASMFVDAAAKGRILIGNGIKNIFRPNISVLPQYAMPSHADRKKLEKRLEEVRMNPEKLLNHENSLMHYMPGSAATVMETVGRTSQYLDTLRPDVDRKAPLDPKPVASAVQKSEYENALDIANQPAFILVKIKEGTVTAKDIQHLDALYPSLADSMRKQVADQIIDQVSKNKPIPYKTRIGVSMFLKQPMDSTMTPMGFQNAQMPMSAKSGAQQPQMQMGQPSKGRPSAPSLQKMPGLFQTHEQAKTLHRNKP